jgi:hypothetical protein
MPNNTIRGAIFRGYRVIGPTPPLAIGDAYGGGYFAGQISTAGNGVADYNLVVAPLSTGQASRQFKTSDTSTAGTASPIDGPTNSSNMNDASHPAAQFCEGLTIGGYSDWYMPASKELEVCYYNLKPTTTSNNTNSPGGNTYAVPSRAGNYSAGTPAQTGASLFKSGGAQAFTAGNYWWSTNNSSYGATVQSFASGTNYSFYSKTASVRVRAVRRVAV